MKNGFFAAVLVSAVAAGSAQAADKPLYQAKNAVIDARIRTAFPDADAFAAAKVVGEMFADKVEVGRPSGGSNPTAREDILKGLAAESIAFRKQMPDFRIEERDLFVADNGVVMTGRMEARAISGQKMDTSFVTVFTRDKSGHIVAENTYEVPHKPAQ